MRFQSIAALFPYPFNFLAFYVIDVLAIHIRNSIKLLYKCINDKSKYCERDEKTIMIFPGRFFRHLLYLLKLPDKQIKVSAHVHAKQCEQDHLKMYTYTQIHATTHSIQQMQYTDITYPHTYIYEKRRKNTNLDIT